jgi:hypothetical protein
LAARAKWCRRLAGQTSGDHVRDSLQAIASDLERRAHGTAEQT